jgi:hypothetical protein
MITSAWTSTAKRDFLMGVHQRSDAYMLALYSANADLGPSTEFYNTRGEVKGKGYQAGGKLLSGYTCEVQGVSAFLTWVDPVEWRPASITARGGLIYNASKENRALAVLDLGEEYRSTNGRFLLTLPEAGLETAIIRLV